MAAQLTHAAGESFVYFFREDEDLEYGPNQTPDRECDCAHDFTRGYGCLYDEGCCECLGRGLKLPVIHAVVLSSPNEGNLVELSMRLREAEIPHRLIREPDAPWSGHAMALGIEPTRDRAKLRPFLRKYKLLKGDNTNG